MHGLPQGSDVSAAANAPNLAANVLAARSLVSKVTEESLDDDDAAISGSAAVRLPQPSAEPIQPQHHDGRCSHDNWECPRQLQWLGFLQPLASVLLHTLAERSVKQLERG